MWLLPDFHFSEARLPLERPLLSYNRWRSAPLPYTGRQKRDQGRRQQMKKRVKPKAPEEEERSLYGHGRSQLFTMI
jgi:hypothetical protein